jgi:hypothetical protein
LVRRPQTTIYTILLFIALVSLVISSLILAWEMWQYDLQYNPPANMRSAAQPAFTQSLRV